VSDSEPLGDAFDYLDPAVLLGQWTDETAVRRGPVMFTIDFVRYVPASAERFLVARALLAPSTALDLRDQLGDAWHEYDEWSRSEEGR
jgi:hypothetical protein